MCVPFCAFNHFTFSLSRVCAFFSCTLVQRGWKSQKKLFHIFFIFILCFHVFFFSSFSTFYRLIGKLCSTKCPIKFYVNLKGFTSLMVMEVRQNGGRQKGKSVDNEGGRLNDHKNWPIIPNHLPSVKKSKEKKEMFSLPIIALNNSLYSQTKT